MTAIVCATPASAQTTLVRTVRNATAQATAQAVTGGGTTLVRSPTMQQALANQANNQARIAATRNIVLEARNAAIAATRANPTNGLATNGLDPIAAIKDAMAKAAAGDSAGANAKLASASAANDATGKATWQGAGLPSQTTDASGNVTVTINQTDARALLSWNRFDIGAQTTLNFNQKLNGVAQKNWTVVNRVVDSVAPSTILGKMTADGTVVVLNSRGIIFGQNSQVNTQSLLVSTLELGAGQALTNSITQALTLKQRNDDYLQNGLFNSVANGAAFLSPDYASAGITRWDATSYTLVPVEGAIVLDAGAQITADTGGYIIAAAPQIDSSAHLTATEGQVSLQGGREIYVTESSGDSSSADPNVRGFLLRSFLFGRDDPTLPPPSRLPDDGVVINRGLIDSKRGYISLGTGLLGSVENDGLLQATTSVSRNGKIALYGGSVTIGGSATVNNAGAIAITPDEDGETIPQGDANNPPSFKSSQIVIGDYGRSNGDSTNLVGTRTPSLFTMGQNALIYAPNANMVVGRDATTPDPLTSALVSGIDILDGATIDVSGLKDVQLKASANSIQITPVKRNELRDTPNYREVAVGDNFTLNGTTLYIDPRVSGVRSDGVAWVGSPLIEAASIVSQLPVTVSELMTKGGNVTLSVNGLTKAGDPLKAPHVNIARTALIDISGGWVNYASGLVRVSNLITADGRLVDISQADPNATYIGVADGYTAAQPNFGISATFTNTLQQGSNAEPAYDEGRDAGTLIVTAPAINLAGTIAGQAFAGARQLAAAKQASGSATFAAGTRAAQASKYELPVGGAVQIGSFTGGSQAALGADIVVYGGTRNADVSYAQTLLSADMLSAAGLSALSLQTSGAVTFTGGGETLLDPSAVTLAGASSLNLAAGGTLTVQAGRTISFAGSVTVPGGTISAQTIDIATPDGLGVNFDHVGSAFTATDDIAVAYAPASDTAGYYDISVTGKLSAAGRFSNDLLVTDGLYSGAAWLNGGKISLMVAPNVFAGISSDGGKTTSDYLDLSGSIAIASGALLDVSAGAYVSTKGVVTTTAKGGSISLIDNTIYAPVVQFYWDGSTVVRNRYRYQYPSVWRSGITFNESALKAFGFAGSGTFTLVSPDITFGSDNKSGSSHVGLDFLSATGFGGLNLTSLRSQSITDPFTGVANDAAILATTDFTIHAGETLNLTQTLLPTQLNVSDLNAVRTLASGGSLTSVLSPAVPVNAWDRLSASLTLGGLTELVIDAGGTLTGAAQASVTASKIDNEGTILIHGGTLLQRDSLPSFLADSGIGIGGESGLGFGDVFGDARGDGTFSAGGTNLLGRQYSISQGTFSLTNQQLLQTGEIYLLGKLNQGEGIRLAAGSMTDLSGTVIYNPYAAIKRDGTRVVTGKLISGGTIATSAKSVSYTVFFATPTFGRDAFEQSTDIIVPSYWHIAEAGRTLNALAGAALDISGAAANFDVASSASAFVSTPQWSDAGTLSAMAGGTIAGATVLATGGAASATGGTLEWLKPIVTDNLAGTNANRLLDTQIEASGFDTLIARGGLSFDGADVSLNLRKSLIVENEPTLVAGAVLPATSAKDLVISANAGTHATVNAAYIRLSGINGRISGSSTLAGHTGSAAVTLNAGALGMDVVGAVLFDGSIASTTLTSAADLRLTGVDNRSSTTAPSLLNGELLTQGDLTIDAARTYATTGTGNLQRIIEDLRAGNALKTDALPFEIDAFGKSTITFLGTHINTATPLSAGSYLRVQAANIVQDGYLAAPLGILELGGNGTGSIAGVSSFASGASNIRAIATSSLTFGAGSVSTVSGANVTVGGASASIPYGTTTDLTEYFFQPTEVNPLTAPPTGQFILTGAAIDVAAGANLNGRGGGDLFAYEFVSGTGGSRDVLSRFNNDQYSANSYNAATGVGYQYADKRQVFAMVPADQASKIAYYDPIYSADYGASGPVDLYGAAVGRTVHLDGGSGIAAGDYVLLPAHYALLPGAYRVVENTDRAAPYAGTSSTLLDGSIVMGGTYGTAGAGLSDSARHSFTIQAQSSFLKYSTLDTTAATADFKAQAASAGTIAPSLPLDSARVILSPLTSLKIDGSLDLTPATGGQGTKIDIAGINIVIGAVDPGTADTLFLSNATLANLNANSLLIGGQRRDNADGTTTLNIASSTITVDGDAVLRAPELLFVVGSKDASTGSPKPALTIAGGASLTATGVLSDTRSGDYIIQSDSSASATDTYALTGIGAALRLSSGSERLFDRQGDYAQRNTLKGANLIIGAANLTATDIALDSSRNFTISNASNLAATNIAVSGDVINMGAGGINSAIEAKLAAASRLTLRSPDKVSFANGTHAFNDLTIDAPAISRIASSAVQQAAVANVTITAKAFDWYNSSADFTGCTLAAAHGCGTAGSALSIVADTISFGSGNVGVYGFNNQSKVSLSAAKGIYVGGSGGLSVANIAGSAAATDSALALSAPFIIDSSTIVDPRDQKVKANYAFETRGAFSLVAPALAAGASAPTPAGNRVPGAKISIGSADAPVASALIDGASIIATAGSIDIESQGDITLANAANLSVPGYTKTFGDAVDSTTVSAGGGTLSLVSLTGNIALPATASLITDSGIGTAGALNLLASEGAIALAAKVNPGVTGARGGSFSYDTQKSAFDLAGFVSNYGSLFEGDVTIRAGGGNLALNAGQTIRAASVTLTADSTSAGEGLITVAGTIDTSGRSVAGMTLADAQGINVNGGDIALYGNNGLTLTGTALLDTHTSGYLDADTRQASAGNVTLGIASQSAALTIADGAVIDVGARRTSGQTGNRLVAQTVKDPVALTDATVYKFVAADTGGTVILRAPVDDATNSHVNIVLPKVLPVKGAASIQIEGFKRYDLDALAKRAVTVGDIAGISGNASRVDLDPSYGADDTNDDGYTSPYFNTANVLAADFVTADGLVSIPHFIRNFAVTAADGSSFDPVIRMRPGVELDSQKTVNLASNWNLGAGIVDTARAKADGLLVSMPDLNYGYAADGSEYLAVVAGKEASLFQNYTDMTYRVGGSAAGEAPIVTVRAAKTLATQYSITDGFFTFRDTSDPVYMNAALGGGDRKVQVAATFTCGGAAVQDCSNVVNFADVAAQYATGGTDKTTIAAINLANIAAGTDVTMYTAPFSQRANTAGALPGLTGDGSDAYGNPIGAAELFPLLNGGTDYAKSSSLRLVGGAGATISANPLHVDRGSGGDVLINGEHSYTITTTAGFASYSTDPATGEAALQMRVNPTILSGNPVQWATANTSFLSSDAASGVGLSADGGGDYYTVLTWGADKSAKATYLRTKAEAYFKTVNATSYDFNAYSRLTSAQQDALRIGVLQGAVKQPSGIAARLSDILAFLSSIDPSNGKTIGENVAANVISGKFAAADAKAPAPASMNSFTKTVNYGSLVRTGDGTIDIAAARDVKLLRSDPIVYRYSPTNDGSRYEVGGTAVYTAGHIATTTPVTASTADGKTTLGLIFAQSASDPSYLSSAYVPTSLEQFLQQPELLTGGGSITITAGRDVVGRRDYWSEHNRATSAPYKYNLTAGDSLAGISAAMRSRIGTGSQLWRTGTIGQDTLAGINPALFSSGVGVLGGGDITVKAGGNVTDLTIAIDTSLVTANARQSLNESSTERFAALSAVDAGTGLASAPVLATLGGGSLALSAGGDLVGGLIDLGSGTGTLNVGGSIVGSTTPVSYSGSAASSTTDSLLLRIADANVSATVNGSVAMTGITALGTGATNVESNSAGFYSPLAGFNLVADGGVTLAGDASNLVTYVNSSQQVVPAGYVLAPTLNIAALTDDIVLTSKAGGTAAPYLMYPSAVGQLSLLSGGSITNSAIAMLDSDPSYLPGVFSAYQGVYNGVTNPVSGQNLLSARSLGFDWPTFTLSTPDTVLRLYHNSAITHSGDAVPVRVYADGSLVNNNIQLSKQARIGAGKDILNLYFVGQNVNASDVTRVTAGRDIIGTTLSDVVSLKQFVLANSFVLGGPGSLDIEAGRNLGPFISSGVVNGVAYAGGILTVGNNLNPWLGSSGADISAQFGVANGADYTALRETYLDPVNLSQLDGDLFVQTTDVNGNVHPDRTKPVYALLLAQWLEQNAPAAFASVFGDLTITSSADLSAAAYTRYNNLYAAFANLSQIEQNRFLINTLYFGELAAASDPTGPSYQQYVRGYRAVQTLFPASLGYTDNLATYTTDPATISADHPLGEPTRILVNGQPLVATRKLTGNADLRLATIETQRGGNITILGPGGDFITGSVVRTSEQIARKSTTAVTKGIGYAAGELPLASTVQSTNFTSVPLGYEGILTLRGGAISAFTDGDFRINQSRLFTLAGGDITMWSSNGDLNAGQGPKSASNFPPITINFSLDGNTEVDSAGSVSGAGIGAFKSSPTDPAASVTLIAPAGTVDAGDAGVRASGNVVVAAARVANADNFKAGGSISGVPSAAAVAAPAAPASAASSVVANVARIANSNRDSNGKTIITVEVTSLNNCSDDDTGNDKKTC